jgi:phosphoenolpyruvate carboxylase
MGTYSEWDEEKKLDFLTRELKGKRPLVPVSMEVRRLQGFSILNLIPV